MASFSAFAIATLLISLRLIPTLGFAAPFTLLRVPGLVRMLLAMSLAAWMVSVFPEAAADIPVQGATLLAAAATELLVGIAMALPLQLAFAAIQTVGKLVDLQAGFAFATLVDPTTKAQLPLVGTLFAYCAAAIFFTTTGPVDLIAVWAASLEVTPVGAGLTPNALPALLTYISSLFVLAVGAGGLLILTLFLIDLAIAFMSRSLPQMNVLFLGFQVKTLATLALLPATMSLSAALFLRMMRLAVEATLGMV